jgi:segregation and condensation protein A
MELGRSKRPYSPWFEVLTLNWPLFLGIDNFRPSVCLCRGAKGFKIFPLASLVFPRSFMDVPFNPSVETLSDSSFVVDIEGYEGPLDLLLDLAHRQKVDLQKISVLALAEQYIAFIEAATNLRLELAADYLVMAAWLAYLKSRLLLPKAEKGGEPEADELGGDLSRRLRQLEAIRNAARALIERPRLGRDMFLHGQSEAIQRVASKQWEANLFDLLAAYANKRPNPRLIRVAVKQRLVWSLSRARGEIEKLVGWSVDWMLLDAKLNQYCTTPELRRTVKASTLSACLEMAREGLISIKQERAFAPFSIKRRDGDQVRREEMTVAP